MKKDALPDSIKKRQLLNEEKVSAERLISLGGLYLEQGQLCDAATFFRRASHQEGLERVQVLALEQGDSFLFELASKDSEQGDNPEAWVEVGRKAMELEKFSHAVRAFRKAGNEDFLKEAEEAMAKEAKEPGE